MLVLPMPRKGRRWGLVLASESFSGLDLKGFLGRDPGVACECAGPLREVKGRFFMDPLCRNCIFKESPETVLGKNLYLAVDKLGKKKDKSAFRDVGYDRFTEGWPSG